MNIYLFDDLTDMNKKKLEVYKLTHRKRVEELLADHAVAPFVTEPRRLSVFTSIHLLSFTHPLLPSSPSSRVYFSLSHLLQSLTE